MSKKHVEIEIFDKEVEQVLTGGGVPVTQTGNVVNSNFSSPLYSLNVGLSGCSNVETYMEHNWNEVNGEPTTTDLKPAAFDNTASGLQTTGGCISFRPTPLPTISGGQLNFTGTTGPTSYPELVGNHDFNNTNGGTYPGFIEYTSISSAVPFYYAVSNQGHISPTIAGPEQWYAATQPCFGFFFSKGVAPVGPIEINQSGAFLKFNAADSDTCGQSGDENVACVYQVIQGLTAGKTYELKIKMKQPATGSGWRFGLGDWVGLPGGLVSGGNTYINLGGDSADIYGSGGPGSLDGVGGTNTPWDASLSSVQSSTFVSQGGNEVLVVNFNNNEANHLSPGCPLEIDFISIKEQTVNPYNASGIYTLIDVFDNNAGAVATTAKIKLDIDTINTSAGADGDVVMINVHSNPPVGQPNLQGFIDQSDFKIITNNLAAGIIGTDPLIQGMNEITVPINGVSSSGSYSANERLFSLQVINPTGTTVVFNSIDVVYEYTTTPTYVSQINEEKSVVGKLEVSDSEDFPLNLSYTVSDGKDLESRFGDYSQTFDLPATANNNRVLNHIWNSNVDQSDKKLFGVKDCRVIVDGVPFFTGMMQVKASMHKGSPISYNCTLYGGNFSWMSTLKDKNLCEVFEDSDTFQFDYVNIEGTFLETSATSNIQYPLISRKDFNPQGLANYVNLINTESFSDWQPAFYVKNILTKIFKNVGYTIESEFINNTNHFSRLICDFPFMKNDQMDEATRYSCHVKRQHLDYQLFATDTPLNTLHTLGPDGDGWHTMILNQNIEDPANSYNLTTGVWTCQQSGTYDVVTSNGAAQIHLNTQACFATSGNNCVWENNSTSQDTWRWGYRTKVTHDPFGTPSYSYVGFPSASGWMPVAAQPLDYYSGPPICPINNGCGDYADDMTGNTIPTGTVVLQVGDTIELQVYFVGSSSGACVPDVNILCGYDNQFPNCIAPELNIKFNATVPNIGDTIKLNEILPCDTTQIDFIKSISHLFNLYFTTDVQSKKVYIEPFNEFFKDYSEGINWDEKVDYTEPISDDYDIGLKRDLHIKYKTDAADKFATDLNYKNNIWGEENRLYNYKETLGEDYESGEVVLENPIFASTTQVWDNDAHDNPPTNKAPVLIPNMWNEDCPWGIGNMNSPWRPSTIIEGHVPRIYYYAWEGAVTGTTLPSGFVPNAGGEPTYFSVQWSNGINVQDQQWYPRATFIDWEERIHSITQRPSLSFNDETFIAPGQFTENTTPGLYRTYYKNMIEQLKKAPRIRTVSVNLKVSDILKLDIRKLVYLDESWWRINRIVEFSPSKNESTKVELIQWLDVGYWPVYLNNDIIKYT